MRHIKRHVWARHTGKWGGTLYIAKKNAIIEVNQDEPFVGIAKLDFGQEAVVEQDRQKRKWIVNRKLTNTLQRAERKK